ncbi:MAG: DUF512 domain-containing protein [Candidatus Cloacimonadaceae bacterium]|nr:DUF512 domain-containing protein [Candidatus Cloacimonadaceae bacterium]
MPLIIQNVLKSSLSAVYGLKAGDTLLRINGMQIEDFFDLEYYASDYELDVEYFDTEGNTAFVKILRQNNRPLGIEPEPYKHNHCQNNCIFCFIDQMPPNMRGTLYNKDDDYLFSFVFGNYITLTNLEPGEIKRIIEQHISPLYISVHTTDNELRRSMMRYRKEFDLMKLLKNLSKRGISFHTQIVLLPGINDGIHLEKSLRYLIAKGLNTLSIGIVPVGLTDHRHRLTPLRCFDAELASYTLDLIERLRLELKTDLIYAADEFYLLAKREIPEKEYYGDYPQLENGIGMISLTMQNFKRKKSAFVRELQKKNARYLMLASISAFPYVQRVADRVNARFPEPVIRCKAISNLTFGKHISVSGLITASDISSQQDATEDEVILLSSNMFNAEGHTLDGIHQIELKTVLERELLIIDQFFEDWDWI